MPLFEKKIKIGGPHRTVEDQLRHTAALRRAHLTDRISGAGYDKILEIEAAMQEEGSDLLQQLSAFTDVARLYPGMQLLVLTCDSASDTARLRSFSVSEWLMASGLSCELTLSDQLGSEDIACQFCIGKHDLKLRRFFLARAAAAAALPSSAAFAKDPFDMHAFIQLAAWQKYGGDLASLSTLSRGHYCSFSVHMQLQVLLDDSMSAYLHLADIATHLESHFDVVQISDV